MDLSPNIYRKFLIDEIMRKSNVDIKLAIHEVDEYSKTWEFTESFRKWIVIRERIGDKIPRPRHIMEILNRIGL